MALVNPVEVILQIVSTVEESNIAMEELGLKDMHA